MITFAVRDGDLQLSGSGYQMVSGPARVQQQIGLALQEQYGIDRFHRSWGSVLSEWIGRVIGEGVTGEIQAEVTRVVRSYMASQEAYVAAARARGMKPLLSPSEIISRVEAIDVRQSQDEVRVRITLEMAGRDQSLTIVTAPGGDRGNP